VSDLQDEPIPSKLDYGFDYDFISPSSAPAPPFETEGTQKDEASNEDNDKEEEYHFRLFTSSTAKHSAQPIRLSPTPPPTDPTEPLSLDKTNFIRPHRPDSYYFTSALAPESIQTLKSEYTTVAVSTADVLNFATSTKWPGTALPWRCIHVQLINPTKAPSHGPGLGSRDAVSQTNSATDSKRITGRPSKKRRILLRKRLALHANVAAQAQLFEEAEREKRTRRNREKKVKRKEREKRKKSRGMDVAQSTSGPGLTEGDEDHSMLEDKDIDLPDAMTETATATVEESPHPATKEAQLNEAIFKSPGPGALPKAAATTTTTTTTTRGSPTARRAAPTSRAPTARAAAA
jgi:hypothetical protein